MYERKAIQEVLKQTAAGCDGGAAVDPVTRVPLDGHTALVPLAMLRRQTIEYREKAAAACVAAASDESCKDPMGYIKRAAELVEGVKLQVPGLTDDCLTFLRKAPSPCAEKHTFSKECVKALNYKGHPLEALHIYCRALRLQHEHIVQECMHCLLKGHNNLDSLGIKKIVDAVEHMEFGRYKFLDAFKQAGANGNDITKLNQELAGRSVVHRLGRKMKMVSDSNNEILAHLQKVPNATVQTHKVLELIADGLKRCGRQDEALKLYYRVLRMQRAHIVEECMQCLRGESPQGNSIAIQKTAAIVQQVEYDRNKIMDGLKRAGADDDVISRTYKELSSRPSEDDCLRKVEAEKEELRTNLRNMECQYKGLQAQLKQKELEYKKTLKECQKLNSEKRIEATNYVAGDIAAFFQQILSGRRTEPADSAWNKANSGAKRQGQRTVRTPPMRLDTKSIDVPVLRLGRDKLTVMYKNIYNASARGAAPVPSTGDVFYFEISVLLRSPCAIGFADEHFKLSCAILGYGASAGRSYGYWGMSGRKYDGRTTQGEAYGEKFGDAGDVIGAGIDLESRRMFFTKNGRMQGWAFQNVPSKVELYPTVTFWHYDKQKVKVNFGQQAFRFDLEELKK